MSIVGIDYGKRKIGLAVSEGQLAEPFKVVRVLSKEEAVDKVARVPDVSSAEQIIVGISEGKMADETKEFGKKLEEKLGTPVHFQDETLTTKQAQEMSRDAGIKRKKRRELEDAYSATLILQAYLDSK